MTRHPPWPLCRGREWAPPPRSLAADAHDCIMVRILAIHRIQGCGADGATPGRLPSDRLVPSSASLGGDPVRPLIERMSLDHHGSAVLAAVEDASRRLRRCRKRASWTASAPGALPSGRSGRRDGPLRPNKGMEAHSRGSRAHRKKEEPCCDFVLDKKGPIQGGASGLPAPEQSRSLRKRSA